MNADLQAFFDQQQGEFADAQRRANEPPANGVHTLLITGLGKPRTIAKEGKNPMHILPLSFKVLDQGTYDGYEFSHEFNTYSWETLLSFVNIANGGKPYPTKDIPVILDRAITGGTAFVAEISRRTDTKTQRVYPSIRAQREASSD